MSDSEFGSELSELTDSETEPELNAQTPVVSPKNLGDDGKMLRRSTDFDSLSNLEEYLQRISNIFEVYFSGEGVRSYVLQSEAYLILPDYWGGVEAARQCHACFA